MFFKRTVYFQAHHERYREARVLLRAGEWNGAIYLGGYAIECLLKALVCRRFGLSRLPREFWSHDYGRLMRAAGLDQAIQRSAFARMLFDSINAQWDVRMRYSGTRRSAAEAREFLDRVGWICKWLTTVR